jgi:ParB family chromosome partitioning protein
MTAKPSSPRGLGRGLSALLGDVPTAQDNASKGNGGRNVAVDLISPNPFQPRRTFDEQDLRELTESIRANGVLQPIVVRTDPKDAARFQLIAGERRWRSAQRAGLHDIPVVIREMTDDDALEIAIVENVQRAGLNAIEEALGYQSLVERFSYTQEDLATNIGKSRSHIANMLRLLQLPSRIRQMLEEGQLTAGHARALITAKDPIALAEEAVRKGLSVREVEALVNFARTEPAKGGRKAKLPKDIDTVRLERDIKSAIGCAVSIDVDTAKESGKLVIRFADMDKLDAVTQRLLRG